jgi:hypothetical protein
VALPQLLWLAQPQQEQPLQEQQQQLVRRQPQVQRRLRAQQRVLAQVLPRQLEQPQAQLPLALLQVQPQVLEQELLLALLAKLLLALVL